MSAKSRARMNAGIYRPQRGQEPPGASGRVAKLPTSRRKVLLAKLAGCQPWERDGIREYLRKDGSEKALAMLAELESEWGGGQ